MRTPQDQGERWTPRDVAKYLGVSRAQIYAMADRNELPHTRSGAFLSFDPDAIRAWAEAHTR